MLIIGIHKAEGDIYRLENEADELDGQMRQTKK